MSYHHFKDSNGRVFKANVYCSYHKGVDSEFSLEDAYYLDGEEVPKDEIYDAEMGDEVNTIGMEGDL